ncbi:MAG: glutamate 5-kinase [Cellulomonadaceae bacterium]|jgi:glutamate 5-kinase|nr:glutamate 5-kinase [Cellulomonadaceae bacterium]
MTKERASIADAQRIVVKIGSSSLTNPDGHLSDDALTALVVTLATAMSSGAKVVLVTSGAVAAGLGPLNLSERPQDLATVQAAASVGQGALIAHYSHAFAQHHHHVGQVLLTSEDAENGPRYANAQRTLTRMLELGVIPIVNENDTVTTEELTFGDNDRLAALVAQLLSADALILLTDVDGLHTASPRSEGAERISFVAHMDDVAHVPVSPYGSAVGTGGMVTKLTAARLATNAGIPTVITESGNLFAALRGQDVGTYFAPVAR